MLREILLTFLPDHTGGPGYEFVVGFLGLIALGACPVPISPDLPVKEAAYYAETARTIAVLVADRCMELGKGLEQHISKQTTEASFRCIPIRPFTQRPCTRPEDFQISSDRYVDLNRAGYVIFTSGTTGPPKGESRHWAELFSSFA